MAPETESSRIVRIQKKQEKPKVAHRSELWPCYWPWVVTLALDDMVTGIGSCCGVLWNIRIVAKTVEKAESNGFSRHVFRWAAGLEQELGENRR